MKKHIARLFEDYERSTYGLSEEELTSPVPIPEKLQRLRKISKDLGFKKMYDKAVKDHQASYKNIDHKEKEQMRRIEHKLTERQLGKLLQMDFPKRLKEAMRNREIYTYADAVKIFYENWGINLHHSVTEEDTHKFEWVCIFVNFRPTLLKYGLMTSAERKQAKRAFTDVFESIVSQFEKMLTNGNQNS